MASHTGADETAGVIYLHGVRYVRDPLSAVFEDLPDEELQMLAANIEADGQTLPITINSHTGRVIDGWQRLRACELLQIEPNVVSEDIRDPARRVMGLNVHRRGSKEPNAGQRILRAIELWDLDPSHNKRMRKGRTRPWPAEKWVMEAAGVSRASYSQLKYALEHDAEYQTKFEAEIRSGQLTVDEARRAAKSQRDEAEWAAKHEPSEVRDASFTAPKAGPPRLETHEVVPSSPNEDEWKDVLRERLLEMSPTGFEHFTAALLKATGSVDVQVTGRTNDGGIDGFAVQPGLAKVRVAFQSKRYKDSVGSAAVRDFRGAFVNRYESGVFITTGSFTREAVQQASSPPEVNLIDGQRICDLLKEHRLGVHTETIEQVTVDYPYFDHFEDSQ